MPAHRTQNSRHLRVEANPTVGAPQLNIISPTPQTFVFSSIPEASTSHPLPNVEASRSLPDLGYYTSTFHARSEDYSYSPTSSYDSPVSGASVSSFFVSPSSSIYTGSSPGTPSSSYSPSPSPSNENGDFRRPRSLSTASIAPYPLPSHEFETKSNGQQRTQPPRPPNPWICFRNFRTQQYKEQQKYPEFLKGMKVRSAPTSPAQGILGLDGETGRRPRQADLSKIIADEWKALSDAERAPFIRMSEEEKIKHARKYPNYKYQPRRKTDSTKKSKDRSESVGKSPAKRARSSSRARPRAASLANDDEELCEITVPVPPPHQPQMSVDQPPPPQHAGFDTAMAHMSMHDLGLSVGQHNDSDETIYAGGSAGDPEKDWTCLPEQTLLPFSWDASDQVGDAAVLGDVLNPGASNSAEHEKDEEDDFSKPMFVWFPQANNNNAQQANISFSAEPECESAPAQRASDNNAFVNFSGVPSNFNFEAASLGFHFDGFDFSSMDDMDAPELRRDSVSSVGSYDLPGSNEMYSTLMDGISALGFDPNNMMDTSAFQSYHAEPSSSQPTNRSNTPSLRIDTTNIPGFRIPPSPRRASIASETVYKSADGMLCPPNMAQQQRPGMTHRRSKTLSAVTPSFFLNNNNTQANDDATPASTSTPTPSTTASELRTITTPNAFNKECSTSVLVPKVMDPNFEKDLAAYSQTLFSITASDSFSASKGLSAKRKTTPLPVSKSQNLDDCDFDLNADFDFDAEFGDMVCLDGTRAPPSST